MFIIYPQSRAKRWGLVAAKWFIFLLSTVGGTAIIFCAIVLRNPLWKASVWRLFNRSWFGFVHSISTNTRGFILLEIGIPALVFLVTLAALYVVRMRDRQSVSLKEPLTASLAVAVVLSCLWSALFAWSIVGSAYDDRQALANKADSLAQQNTELKVKLENKKEMLDPNDPEINQMAEIIELFNRFRNETGGTLPKCHITVTAPEDSAAIAIVVAHLAVIGSSCEEDGPVDPTLSSDIESKTMNGMIPGMIILHAARNFAAADQLAVGLGNRIRVQRNYNVPDGSPRNFIWLQFGMGTKWNSQLR